jgi:hypothetical protein
MQLYSVHVRRHGLDPDRDLVLVKEGFSWPAFFLSFLWALWQRLWLAAAVIFAAHAAVGGAAVALGANPLAEAALSLGLAAVVGYLANDLRRRKLAKQGFVFAGVVAADDADAALKRYLDSDPALAADVRP